MIGWRLLILTIGLLVIWQILVLLTKVPPYILPGPLPVGATLVEYAPVLLRHLGTTFSEIVIGLLLGALLGTSCALSMITWPLLKRWMLPVLVVSQAIPVFALAPILVLWFGYGMASKIAMAVLIIFFPVTTSFYQGMRRTNPDLLELARIMDGKPIHILRYIIIPSALPSLAAGLRVAAAVAPIGAIVGEWVGSSSGLGFLMLHANARMQIDLMFAALALLSTVSLLLYYTVDKLLDNCIYWKSKQGISP